MFDEDLPCLFIDSQYERRSEQPNDQAFVNASLPSFSSHIREVLV